MFRRRRALGGAAAVCGRGGAEAGDTACGESGRGRAMDVLGDEAGLSELHAASVMTADAAQTTSPTEDYVRKEFTVVTLPSSVAWWAAPRARTPQRPDHKQRLKQQPDTAGEVGVEPEGIRVRDELRDVPGKHRNKEDRHQKTERHPPPGQQCQACAEGDFDHARGDHDEVSVQRQPGGTWAWKAFRAK